MSEVMKITVEYQDNKGTHKIEVETDLTADPQTAACAALFRYGASNSNPWRILDENGEQQHVNGNFRNVDEFDGVF